MAEALLRRHAGDRFEVYSAGMDPNGIHPLAERVLNEVDIETFDLRSKHVSEYMGRIFFHYVIIVCQDAQETCPRIFPGMQERLFWPFEDPPAFQGSSEERLAKFREVRDQIDAKICEWVASLETADVFTDD